MHYYLIILRKKGDYYSGEYEELWLPTSTSEIERALNNLGCRLVLPDYEVTYASFGYPVINELAYDADILALNRLAQMLLGLSGTPGRLCAELIYRKCKNIYDVISHLENRPKLVVLEKIKNIYDAGEMWYKRDYYASGCDKFIPYEEHVHELEHLEDDTFGRRLIEYAMEELRGRYFRFTPYGLVYEDPEDMLPF